MTTHTTKTSHTQTTPTKAQHEEPLAHAAMAAAPEPNVAPQPAVNPPAPAAPPAPAPNPTPVGWPPVLQIPSPPQGFVPTPGADYRGLLPRRSQMVAMPEVLNEMSNFPDWVAIFGATAPSLAEVKQTVGGAGSWTLLRKQLTAYDHYCRTEEGRAWMAAQPILGRLTPAFALAVAGNAAIATKYPGFASLLSARKGIAKKGVSTKKANKKLEAEGKAPTKGGVGKKRVKQEEKALLTAAQQQQQQATPPQAPAPANGGGGASAPAAANGGGNGAPAPAGNGAQGGNGAAHA
jgi:hypothetical protein